MKYLLSIAIVLISFSFSGSVVSFRENSYAVSPSELREWVSYLASDELKGRSNGSPEMREAAIWLSGKFKEFGAFPPDDLDGYLQPFQTLSRGRSVSERNVVGAIEGTDPGLKNEYIILTAHFDHVGIRNAIDGDSIYNGADDNAAGTCTLSGIAKTINFDNMAGLVDHFSNLVIWLSKCTENIEWTDPGLERYK